MYLSHSKKIVALLAFIVLFSTVQKVNAFSYEDTEIIFNSVYTSSNTGNLSDISSLNGKDGQDGQDGKDGQDGLSGQNGQPGTNGSVTNSKSSASIYIESNKNGEKVIEIYKSDTTDESSTVVETSVIASDSNTETETEESETVVTPDGVGKQKIMLILENIRLILFKYVNQLF